MEVTTSRIASSAGNNMKVLTEENKMTQWDAKFDLMAAYAKATKFTTVRFILQEWDIPRFSFELLAKPHTY